MAAMAQDVSEPLGTRWRVADEETLKLSTALTLTLLTRTRAWLHVHISNSPVMDPDGAER